ncbi:MAG: ion transporter [Aminivibrio sp.]|jgi:hypothetical protein
MKTFSFKREYYSRKIELFFRRQAVETALIILISASIVVAVASLLFDDDWLEGLNLAFSVLFAAELTARLVTYGDRGRDYLKDWWMDWAATIPWEMFLAFLFPGGGASMLRLLRLPRIFRLLRFRRVKRTEAARWASYRFRRLMEVSIWRQSLTLLLVSMVFVWFFTLLLDRAGLTSDHGGNFWFSLITMISSDSIFEVAGQDSMVKGLVLLLSFIGIILFNGILIAIIIGKLMERLEQMKDAGEVRERGHIILLGWNECIPHILNELESFCVTERKPPVKVVVMGENPPYSSGWGLSSSPYVKVITRTGSFQNEEALERISAHKAAAVVVLGETSDDRLLSERLNDPIVTRTLLSFETLLDDKKHARRGPAPVTILNYLDLGNSLHVTDFLRPFGPGNARIFFNPLFFIGSLISAMCLNPYAEDIFNELLTAEGNEFHFVEPPIGPGTVWGDIINSFPRSVPAGYVNGDGEIRMAPLPEEPLPENSRIVVLSENSWDSSIFTRPGRPDRPKGLSLRCPGPSLPGKNLVIVGVNPKLPFILQSLGRLNMKVTVADNQTEEEFSAWYGEYSRDPLPAGVSFRECRFRSEEEILGALDMADTGIIILLADGHLLNSSTPDRIDAETVSRLLLLSRLIDKSASGDVRIIAETLTVDTEVIVRNIRNCSNVIGPLTIGRLLTIFTLQPEFEPVYKALIQLGEIDFICCPASEALRGAGEAPVTFGELIAVGDNGAVPMGWVAPPEGADIEGDRDGLRRAAPSVVLNPPKESVLPEGAEIIFLKREV